MSKICLIAGCSHTAGSEIDGSDDSTYNRQHSYGNLLAHKLGYTPVNIAICGYSNSAIARSVLEWFSKHDTTDVFVLIGWAESRRLEAPYMDPSWCRSSNTKMFPDWFPEASRNFMQIIAGGRYEGKEAEVADEYRRFMLTDSPYNNVLSANLILQLQYFLKYKNVDYLMCNTGYMFDLKSTYNIRHMDFYFDSIDRTRYYGLGNDNLSFYLKYKNMGLTHPLSRMSHHGPLAHELHAKELYTFMKKQGMVV